LIGPKKVPKVPTIAIAAKYIQIAEEYLAGKNCKKIYLNGSVEQSITLGIADMAIDIVYTGESLQEQKLQIYDKILASDIVIIGGEK